MLVLSRREAEKVLFPALGITVEVTRVQGKTVRLGIDAPDEIRIVRGELDQFEPKTFHSKSAQSQHTPPQLRQMQGCLDAANLAIRLAMNQMNQHLTAQAGMALENALHCLEELELAVVQHSQHTPIGESWESETASVREASTKYRVSAKPTIPTAAVVAEQEEVRQRLTSLLSEQGFRVVEFAETASLLKYLQVIEQPAVVLAVESVPKESVSQELAQVANTIDDFDPEFQLRISGASKPRRNRLSFSIDCPTDNSVFESAPLPTQITGWFDDSQVAADFESMLQSA